MSWEVKISITGQPCAEEPCQDGGKCSSKGEKVSCSCLPGYFGNRCEQKGAFMFLLFFQAAWQYTLSYYNPDF